MGFGIVVVVVDEEFVGVVRVDVVAGKAFVEFAVCTDTAAVAGNGHCRCPRSKAAKEVLVQLNLKATRLASRRCNSASPSFPDRVMIGARLTQVSSIHS